MAIFIRLQLLYIMIDWGLKLSYSFDVHIVKNISLKLEFFFLKKIFPLILYSVLN